MSYSSASTTPEHTDYDSDSSVEFLVSPLKLHQELEKQLLKERKRAVERGGPTYSDGTRMKIDKKGNIVHHTIVRFERYMEKRRELKAEVEKNVAKHMQRPRMRGIYEDFCLRTRSTNYQNTDPEKKKKFFVYADDKRFSVTVINAIELRR